MFHTLVSLPSSRIFFEDDPVPGVLVDIHRPHWLASAPTTLARPVLPLPPPSPLVLLRQRPSAALEGQARRHDLLAMDNDKDEGDSSIDIVPPVRRRVYGKRGDASKGRCSTGEYRRRQGGA